MQFDVHENTNADSAQRFPYLLDIQSNILSSLPTRFVAPIASEAMLPKHLPERLCPQVTINNKPYRVIGFEAAAIPAKRLGPLVCSLKEQSFELLDCIDAVLSGV
jgi:toxin CcdB